QSSRFQPSTSLSTQRSIISNLLSSFCAYLTMADASDIYPPTAAERPVLPLEVQPSTPLSDPPSALSSPISDIERTRMLSLCGPYSYIDDYRPYANSASRLLST